MAGLPEYSSNAGSRTLRFGTFYMRCTNPRYGIFHSNPRRYLTLTLSLDSSFQRSGQCPSRIFRHCCTAGRLDGRRQATAVTSISWRDTGVPLRSSNRAVPRRTWARENRYQIVLRVHKTPASAILVDTPLEIPFVSGYTA